MRYPAVSPAIFQSRPNRFLAHVLLEDQPVVCHVKNTGRCQELLIPGASVWINHSDNPKRKTAYDLIAVQKGNRLINMDAQAPNQVFAEWAKAGNFLDGMTLLRPEYAYGDSRFDFYWEAGTQRGFVEVKGVTLEENGGTYFPDAPTQRGVKHLDGLRAALEEGYQAWVVFIIQMAAVDFFSPNDKTHPQFGDALRRAIAAGVHALALDCAVTPDSLTLSHPIPILL